MQTAVTDALAGCRATRWRSGPAESRGSRPIPRGSRWPRCPVHAQDTRRGQVADAYHLLADRGHRAVALRQLTYFDQLVPLCSPDVVTVIVLISEIHELAPRFSVEKRVGGASGGPAESLRHTSRSELHSKLARPRRVSDRLSPRLNRGEHLAVNPPTRQAPGPGRGTGTRRSRAAVGR